MKLIVKQPADIVRLPMEFGGVSTISALIGIDVEARGLVPGAPDLVAAGNLLAAALTLEISGGGAGERYLITATVDDAGGARSQEEVEVAVLDLAWVMPDGGAPMLSIAEFVQRFGLDETVRMTDERGDGRIGKDLLVGALTAAQAIVQAALGSRYTLPLVDVPEIVKVWIGDIARARLYPNGAPDGIDAPAKEARRSLERIEDGKSSLPGTPSAPPSDEGGVSFHSGGRAYPDGLKRYGW
jgi:phage gp36-like protein